LAGLQITQWRIPLNYSGYFDEIGSKTAAMRPNGCFPIPYSLVLYYAIGSSSTLSPISAFVNVDVPALVAMSNLLRRRLWAAMSVPS